MITRVELSLDGGRTLEMATRKFPLNSTSHGYLCWVWCHWEFQTPLWKLLRAKEIVVRAFDIGGNTQPEQPTWNLLGMMNNCWYRVKIDIMEGTSSPSSSSSCKPILMFTHPVQPGNMAGGWMVSEEQQPKPPSSISTQILVTPEKIIKDPMTKEATVALRNQFTLQEISKHKDNKSCWIIIDGKVYDVTGFLKEHPGGPQPILLNGGQDASIEFHSIHSTDANQLKERYCIGNVLSELESDVTFTKRDKSLSLSPRHSMPVILVKKRNISHNTRWFRFQLIGSQKKACLPVGQHVLICAHIQDHFVVRPYTPTRPVTNDEDDGYIDIVVKIYFKNMNKAFPNGGIMSQYLDALPIGETIQMKGPAGHIFYLGNGLFRIHGKLVHVNKISMIAGGSGITPIYQLTRAICKDNNDHTQLSLLYANHSVDDILLREDLDKIAKLYSDKFSVWYTVSIKPPSSIEWKFDVGRLNIQMLESHLFLPGSDTIALVCGPPSMIEHASIPNLEAIGFTEDSLFEF